VLHLLLSRNIEDGHDRAGEARRDPGRARPPRGAASVASLLAAVLTELYTYVTSVLAKEEILRRSGRGQEAVASFCAGADAAPAARAWRLVAVPAQAPMNSMCLAHGGVLLGDEDSSYVLDPADLLAVASGAREPAAPGMMPAGQASVLSATGRFFEASNAYSDALFIYSRHRRRIEGSSSVSEPDATVRGLQIDQCAAIAAALSRERSSLHAADELVPGTRRGGIPPAYCEIHRRQWQIAGKKAKEEREGKRGAGWRMFDALGAEMRHGKEE
jgi:hypothetical protein